MNWNFFKELLCIDSTSGKEREVAQWLLTQLEAPVMESMEVGDGTLNLFLKWGTPKVVFCSHMDTVPPYIPPMFPEGMCLLETSLRDPSHSQRAAARLWAPPVPGDSYPPVVPEGTSALTGAAEGGHRFGRQHLFHLRERYFWSLFLRGGTDAGVFKGTGRL